MPVHLEEYQQKVGRAAAAAQRPQKVGHLQTTHVNLVKEENLRHLPEDVPSKVVVFIAKVAMRCTVRRHNYRRHRQMFMEETYQLTTLKTIQSRANNGWKEHVAQENSNGISEESCPGRLVSEMQSETHMTDVIGVSGSKTGNTREFEAVLKEIQNHEENTWKKSS